MKTLLRFSLLALTLLTLPTAWGSPYPFEYFHGGPGEGTPLGEVDVAATTSNSALLRARFDGTSVSGTAYFEYGTSLSYGNQTQNTPLEAKPYVTFGAGMAVGFWSKLGQSVEGLTADTTYHFRLVFTDASGTHLGEDQTFHTRLGGPGWHYLTLSQTGNAALGGQRMALPSTMFRYFNYYKGTDGNVWALHYGDGAWNQTQLTRNANVDDWFTESTYYNHLYYKGKDNHIWALWYQGGRWNNEVITTTANVAGNLQTDTVTNFIYYRGVDRNLWVAWYAQGRWNQAALSGNGRTAGDVAVDSTTHRAYYCGSDWNMWCVWFDGGRWNEAPITKFANVWNNVVVVDPGWGAYYQVNGAAYQESSFDWFEGKQWTESVIQPYVDTSDGALTYFTHHGLLYVGWEGSAWYKSNNGSGWHDSLVGGSNLRDTLNYSPGDGLIYGKTADGHLGVFYYQ